MITLRDVSPADRDLMLAWRNLPEVAAYMYSDHVITPEEHGRWFARMLTDETVKYWIIVQDGRDAGVANLAAIDRRNSRCSWAFYLADPATRGKGAGGFVEYQVLSYVFDGLGLNKLCCEVLAFNEQVVSLHQRFGFQQEGLFRQHIVKKGEKLDVVALALLRSDWDSRRDELAAWLGRIEKRQRRNGVPT